MGSASQVDVLAAARSGDEAAFAELVAPLRSELHAHCYRMLGSAHDADDAVQDALLRAWRGLARFAGHGSLRGWLYRIATNVCLDGIGGRRSRALPVDLGPSSDRAVIDDAPMTDVAWLEPCPTPVLDGAVSGRVEQRESIELAFVAALQHLPGNERAALLLFDVIGLSGNEVAEAMGTTRPAVNSALQRARKLMAAAQPDRSQQQTRRRLGDERLRAIVGAYVTAFERGDTAAVVDLLARDATWSMPPLAGWYRGRAAIADFLARVPMRARWRHRVTGANGQPAVGCYAWDPEAAVFTARVLDVLTLGEDGIAAVTAFLDPALFDRFGLPMTLPATELEPPP